MYGGLDRIFLVNGDAFVLKAEYLKNIALKIKEYFPECKTITMYASIQNIKAKTDEELKELKELGINDLYVGVESGVEEVITHINKGHTVQEAKEQLERLNKVGMTHRALLMLGVAGKGNGQQNAIETAKFLNETKPNLIWVGTLGVFEGTKMEQEVKEGTFVEATEIENLMELKTLLNNIELENVPFYCVHTTNVIPVLGLLPRDRDQMLQKIDAGIKSLGEEALSTTFKIMYQYDCVYIDLDDTLIVDGKVNYEIIAFLYKCINEGKKVILLTRHSVNPLDTLEKYHIYNFFDQIIHLDNN